MSTNKSSKRKKDNKGNKIKATVSRTQVAATPVAPKEMIFGKENYIWMGIGAALVALGLIMMLGGGMDDPNVWDESIIYSFRITVIAPILILSGLAVEIYAIFK